MSACSHSFDSFCTASPPLRPCGSASAAQPVRPSQCGLASNTMQGPVSLRGEVPFVTNSARTQRHDRTHTHTLLVSSSHRLTDGWQPSRQHTTNNQPARGVSPPSQPLRAGGAGIRTFRALAHRRGGDARAQGTEHHAADGGDGVWMKRRKTRSVPTLTR